MVRPDLDKTISRWARVGVLLGGRPARTSPDLERLMLDTARLAPVSPRIFYLAVTWLSRYVSLAIKHGASRELHIATEVCERLTAPRPLFDVQRGNRILARIASDHACPEATR